MVTSRSITICKHRIHRVLLICAAVSRMFMHIFGSSHVANPNIYRHAIASVSSFVNTKGFSLKRKLKSSHPKGTFLLPTPQNHHLYRVYSTNQNVDLTFVNDVVDEEIISNHLMHKSTTAASTPSLGKKESLFRVTAKYAPTGDQPQAIQRLTEQIQQGDKFSVLRGITGTGKTFVMSHVIANIGKPCLVLCHNKTLAAQLARELRNFLSDNAVELFVSYYNMYRPEAFIEKSGTYLKKKSSINAEIDALRHRATRSLLIRDDVVVVASVSCIYGLGFPKEYIDMSSEIHVGQKVIFHQFCEMLDKMLYTVSDNDNDFERGQYQVDDNYENTKRIVVWSPHERFPMQIQLALLPQTNMDNNLDEQRTYIIKSIGSGNEKGLTPLSSVHLFPAKHHIVSNEALENASQLIEEEMRKQVDALRSDGKKEEAERLQSRVIQDLYMLRETGYCHGLENYSRHFGGRDAGEPPDTLLDYFGLMGKRDWLLMVDESHVTLPQLRTMYNGDRERKRKLIKHGYRLPSALDNRPLRDQEFWGRIDQAVFVSATPSDLELSLTDRDPIEMIIRPTFLCDPEIEVRPSEGQLSDFLHEVKKRSLINQRTLAVALSKRDAEDMSAFLIRNEVKSRYIHCGMKTNDRAEALKELQNGSIDCLIGVNLLREGLDLPQVSLVAIFSADKQGFLRSETTIMQTIGRAARNIEGKAILYANSINETMEKCIAETDRRRTMQIAYNELHGQSPQSTKGTTTMSIFDLAKKDIDDEMEFRIPVQKKNAPCGVAEAIQFAETTDTNIIKVSQTKNPPESESIQSNSYTTDHIPASPGVYIWRDSNDKILYIGKAVNLRSRVRSYHAKSAKHSQRIKTMVKKAASVSFLLTPSERDALILESNLIKYHQPPFNVLLKDDEHYPYICATYGDDFPKLMVVPMKSENQSTNSISYRFFGPYTNYKELNTVMDYIEDKYDLRGISFQARYGSVSKHEYQKVFEQMMKEVFLEGSSPKGLLQEMRSEYEHAGVLFESKHNKCRDVVAVGKKNDDKNGAVVVVHVLQLRDGLIGGIFTYSCTLPSGCDTDQDYAEAIATVLTSRHYPSGGESRGNFSWFPDHILLSHVPDDIIGLRSAIRDIGRSAMPPKRSIRVTGAATKGDMVEVDKRTLELAEQNANQAAFEKSVGDMNIGIVDGSGAIELAQLVGCEKPPSRIECYDVSHLQGEATVASRVVFIDGRPVPSLYRKFNIKSVDGINDFASMEEVLERRFRRIPDNIEDTKDPWAIPDLVVVDGGKGQLSSAIKGMLKAGVRPYGDIIQLNEEVKERCSVAICALAKENEDVYIPGTQDPVNTSQDSAALLLLRSLRDESHRFALKAHRSRRSIKNSL